MHFSKFFAGIAMASGALAALSPQQIADGIKLITAKSQALQAPAQSITLLNAPLITVGQGPFPKIIAGFTDITSTGNTLIAQLAGTGPIQKRGEKEHPRDLVARGPDADLVFGAFREFVAVHQALLNILIGKAGLLEKVPVIGQPVATALRGVEGVVDTIAIDLIGLLQSHAPDVTSDANSLDNTLQLTISKYDSIGL
ncbi:hypothetical protein F5B22DRAFT_656519 [Xylaria bambusicola]|uniref:uncharacterized protein n=1 Tax=Xylaria bambusicola TaxID=326684 RepID=UPI00200845C7|nr:uncharacterized protein F5B22DRAFT_656519 [Xylaria bambusicola]KAI0515031.1 hypothetical protein F5B22DRAFT_656519 [Xylaria bambusicola]